MLPTIDINTDNWDLMMVHHCCIRFFVENHLLWENSIREDDDEITWKEFNDILQQVLTTVHIVYRNGS